MPEPIEQPEATPNVRQPSSNDAKLQELKQKYRLDAEVNLYAKGTNGLPLGRGPLMDEVVFNKFAELDATRSKKYLDWMLFQAGGGQEAFKHSRELWGDGTPEKTPEEFFKSFNEEKSDHTISYDEIKLLAQRLKDKGIDATRLIEAAHEIESASAEKDLHRRFQAVLKIIMSNKLAPGLEERLTTELLTNKFKTWIKNQLSTKVRDRVHATFIFNRLLRGVNRKEAEMKWKETEVKRRKEYLFGDQDSLKWDAFGFTRHWPGRHSIYEQVYNNMRQFLLNVVRVNKYNSRVEAYNLKVQEKNKTLPPDQQSVPRMPFNISTDIGKIISDAEGNLSYKGKYPTVQSLAAVNDQIEEMPMRERVTGDIQYAGPKGARSNNAKVYSDDNIDVMVPLTVAASVRSGDPKWPVSDPNQLDIKKGSSYRASTWINYAAGSHDSHEWANTQVIPVFFLIKAGVPKNAQRFMMNVFLDDLTDLQPPYVATIWYVPGGQAEHKFSDVIKYIRNVSDHSVYLAVVRSITKAMNALREWGKEFNPQDIIGDYVKHHREKLQGKRTLGEEIKIRAHQVVMSLLE